VRDICEEDFLRYWLTIRSKDCTLINNTGNKIHVAGNTIVKFVLHFIYSHFLPGGYQIDIKNFFNGQARLWDSLQAKYRPSPEELMQSLHLRRGENLLEIGCGSGWLLNELASRIAPGRLFALDFSREMLKETTAKKFDYPLVVISADATDIPLPDRSLDRVLMVNTFSQFPHPTKVIGEVARVLRKGGRLDIKYFFPREEINAHHNSLSFLTSLGIPDDMTLHRWLNGAGFLTYIADDPGDFAVSARRVS